MRLRHTLGLLVLCLPAALAGQSTTAAVNGRWDIIQNGYHGTMTLRGGSGVITIDGLPQEELTAVTFDGTTITFTRVSYNGAPDNQYYTGRVQGDTAAGTFTQPNKPGGVYHWTAKHLDGGDPDTTYSRWFCVTPDQRQFPAQPGRTWPLPVAGGPQFRAHDYMVYTALCVPRSDGVYVIDSWQTSGPFTLYGGDNWKASLLEGNPGVSMQRNAADLNQYSTPGPGSSAIYVHNNDINKWRGICVLPAGSGMTVEKDCFGGAHNIVPGGPQHGVGTGRATVGLTSTRQDYVSPSAVFQPGGGPDAMFRISLLAPGRTVAGLEIRHTSGAFSVWNTLGDGAWAMAVVHNGRLVNDARGRVSLTLDSWETVLDLYVQDNGSIVGGATRYKVTVFFQDGSKLEIPVV